MSGQKRTLEQSNETTSDPKTGMTESKMDCDSPLSFEEIQEILSLGEEPKKKRINEQSKETTRNLKIPRTETITFTMGCEDPFSFESLRKIPSLFGEEEFEKRKTNKGFKKAIREKTKELERKELIQKQVKTAISDALNILPDAFKKSAGHAHDIVSIKDDQDFQMKDSLRGLLARLEKLEIRYGSSDTNIKWNAIYGKFDASKAEKKYQRDIELILCDSFFGKKHGDESEKHFREQKKGSMFFLSNEDKTNEYYIMFPDLSSHENIKIPLFEYLVYHYHVLKKINIRI
jgi:hypothetical protein